MNPSPSRKDSSDRSSPKAGTAMSKCDRRATPERRKRRRVLISAPVRVRGFDVTSGLDEISTTLDVSRSGFLFVSAQQGFTLGMEVAVILPYSKSRAVAQAEQPGIIARITSLEGGRSAVAIALGAAPENPLQDAAGRKIAKPSSSAAKDPTSAAARPLILAVDSDAAVRNSLKSYLENEGYRVIALSTAAEAREVLQIISPALLIAEIEGEDLPGYELCAHVKGTARLRTIPVMLLTRSAYPSDYANAHSLGAVVCMAKPFRQERLGHVVRLLAPTPAANEHAAPTHAADPKRKASCRSNGKSGSGPKNERRFRS
jgi:CheY-like chemotaxis protein